MFAQFTPTPHAAPAPNIVKVKCEKTGTIYYLDIKTGEKAWRKEDFPNSKHKRTQNLI